MQRLLFRVITAAACGAFACAALATNLWYEDNNMGSAGGMPADFAEKFSHPESFERAAKFIDVYMMRLKVFKDMDDRFIRDVFYAYLKKQNIKLALNVGGGTLAQAANRTNIAGDEVALLQRLKKLGVQVDYFSMQSALDKAPKVDGKKQHYPLNKRVDDIVAYAKAIHAIYPAAEIGIIDSSPSHNFEYREPYKQVKAALAREGIALSYIQLDISFDIPRESRGGVTWQKLRQLEAFVEDDLGAKFGYFATSRKGGHTSSQAFHERVMATLQCYHAAGGSPREFVIASWFPHPEKTVPDTATGDDYPAMRTVLEFGRELKRLDQGGAAAAPQSTGRRGGKSACAR